MALPSSGQKLTYPKYFVLVVASSLVVRSILSSLMAGIGGLENPLFFTAQDLFADSIKSGLAIRAVTARLLDDPRVHAWPALFQSYLFQNPYLRNHISIYHSAPLGMLGLIVFALIMAATSPTVLLVMLLAAFCTGAVVVGRHLEAATSGDRLYGALLLIVAYPALFMLDRGNFHSGFTSLCIIFYAVSAVTGRWRPAGILALAIAINLRPNTATLLLVELADRSDLRATIRSVLAASATVVAIALASYVLAASIDPSYSLPAFLHGLALYNTAFIGGGEGMPWNASLLALSRLLGNFGAVPSAAMSFDQRVVTGIMGAACLAAVALAVARRIGKVEAVFLGATLSVLSTPIFAEYHLLIFAAPLLLAAAGLGVPDRRTIVAQCGPILILIVLCQTLEAWPSAALAAIVAALAFAAPLMASRVALPGIDSRSHVIVFASLFALCAVGGANTLGIAIPAVLFTASLYVLVKAAVGLPRALQEEQGSPRGHEPQDSLAVAPRKATGDMMPISPRSGAIARQFVRFAVVGTAGFAVTTSTIYVTRGLLGPALAAIPAFLVAVTTSWALNRTWTFRYSSEAPLVLQWARYVLWTAPTGITNITVYETLIFLVPFARAHPVVATGAAAISGMLVSFTVMRLIVFKHPSGTPDRHAAACQREPA